MTKSKGVVRPREQGEVKDLGISVNDIILTQLRAKAQTPEKDSGLLGKVRPLRVST